MAPQLHEVACETRTIGPLVLTTPVLRRLGFREMGNRHGPIAAPAELDHGLVAELVTPSRLSDPTALYDLPGWADRFALATRYPDIERRGQGHDDRAGRLLDALYDQRAVLWGDWVACMRTPWPGPVLGCWRTNRRRRGARAWSRETIRRGSGGRHCRSAPSPLAMGGCRCGWMGCMAAPETAPPLRPRAPPSATMPASLAACLWRIVGALATGRGPPLSTSGRGCACIWVPSVP